MAASRLAALRARVAAKEDTLKAQVRESVANAIQRAEEEDKERQAKRRADALLEAKKHSLVAADDSNTPIKRGRLSINGHDKSGSVVHSGVPLEPLCRCGQKAVRRKVHKEGVNHGREFWCCQKQESQGRCRLFEWIEPKDLEDGEATAESVPQVAPSHCRCGLEVARRAVRKEGPNQGREFLCCPKDAGERCRLFEWVVPDAQAGNPTAAISSSATAPKSEEVLCNCGEAAVTWSVKKNGPNFGRSFLKCARPQEQQCSFFTWATGPLPEAAAATDGLVTNTITATVGNGSPNVGRTGSGQTEGEGDNALSASMHQHTSCPTEQQIAWTPPPPERPQGSGRFASALGSGGSGSCFKCGQGGHWSRECPLRVSSDQQ